MAGQRPRLWVGLVAVLVFAGTLSHGFAFDDFLTVVGNVDVRSLGNVGRIFTSTEWSGAGHENHLYRPLTALSFALDHTVFGLRPWGFHLVNVVLHGVVTLLVLALGTSWGLPRGAALVAALLFAVHPVHVEAVANVSGRKDLLAAAFALLSLLGHRRALSHGGPALALAPLALACAFLSKEAGVAALGLILVQDLLLERRKDGSLPADARDARVTRRRMALYATYVVALVAYLVVRHRVVGGFEVATVPYLDNPLAYEATPSRVLSALAVVGRGLALLIAPVQLSPDYSYPVILPVRSASDPWLLAAGLALVGLAATLLKAPRIRPLLAALAAWYALSLFPASNLLFPVGTPFGERILYLPSVAFCLAAGWALWGASGLVPRQARLPATLILLGLLAARSVTYAAVWRDDLTLFGHVARRPDASTKVHHKLGEALAEEGRFAEAAAAGEKALDVAPDNARAMIFVADMYQRMGRVGEASLVLERAAALDPEDPDVHYGLGTLVRDAGDLAGAEVHWRRALALKSDHAPSLSDLGTLHYMSGDLEGARSRWESAVQADPGMASAWFNLGILYVDLGRPQQARAALTRFLAEGEGDYPARAATARRILAELGAPSG